MKSVFFVLLTGAFLSNATFANDLKCIDAAKKEAQLFVAADGAVPLDEVKVVTAFFVEKSENILYYGVGIEYDGFDMGVNVGLLESDCSLALQPNYVTRD